MSENALAPMRIGLVLVHGVGEQCRFDHLSAEVKQLVAALSTRPDTRVTIETRSAQDSSIGATSESWRADVSAPVKIHVAHTPSDMKICLCVHEVWWADLDDKETLWSRVKFWLWGLGFWGVKKFDATSLPGAASMIPPQFPPFPGGDGLRELLVRARLWTFANAFLMSALTVNLLNSVLRGLRLGRLPGVEVFYQYVGDVKLYQDRGTPGQGPLTDLGERRRVPIRRRAVQVFVDAYRANYDRWYVLAHSLGTVVAWNGLMETAHALPNYLSQETYASLKAAKDPVLGPQRSGPVLPVSDMRPARPVWIEADDEVLYRDILFSRLRGFITYGSPLDKFAYLWRAIVPINKDTSVWRSDFEWINVYEHTDPVSSHLSAFSGPAMPAKSPAPANYAYKASPVLLLSHLKYLKPKRKGGSDQFAVRLLNWILAGNSKFTPPGPADANWRHRTNSMAGLFIRIPWWILGMGAMATALAWLGVPAVLDLLKLLSGLLLDGGTLDGLIARAEAGYSSLSFGIRLLGTLGVSAAVVFLAGLIRWLLERTLLSRPQPPEERSKPAAIDTGRVQRV